MFRGAAALFGGVEYQTPWQPLPSSWNMMVMITAMNLRASFPQDSPFNVGAVYKTQIRSKCTSSYERGNTFMWGFTLRTNFNQWRPIHYADPAPEPVIADNDKTKPGRMVCGCRKTGK